MADQVSSGMGAATKRLLYVGAAVVAALILQFKFNIVPLSVGKSSVPTQIELPTEAANQHVTSTVVQSQLPSTAAGKCPAPVVRVNVWAWNAQMGFIFSNGGPKTTANSIMEKHSVCVQISRQDDTEKSKAEQVKFAQLLAKGDPNPGDGIHFVIIMGDGAAQYLASINKTLSKLGTGYQAEIVGAVGYSGNGISGEDAFLGPVEWKDNPQSARGGLVAGVLRDGDWNLALYWAAQNGIANNPDERYYDPEALNWYAVDDYIKAAAAYTAGPDSTHGVCETRQVVHDGKTTSEKRNVCVQGVVTWTPGDVNIATGKGGLVKVLSTKENRYQMPSVLIGIHKWNVGHVKQVTGLLAAAFDGADQVKTYDAALQRAGKASASVYGDESAAYWVKYYKGVREKDKAQNYVELGGSRVANLADNLALFGLLEGVGDESSSMFRATYEGFGNIVKQQYPALVPEFPNVSTAVNTTFLKALAPTLPTEAKADIPEYNESGSISEVVARRNWNIQFDSGRATFTPTAESVLNDLYAALVVNNMSIELDGHTDNTGTPDGNLELSRLRAEAVRGWLQAKSGKLFPFSRFEVKFFGQSQPLASNVTATGKAQNRRVTVVLGTKG